MGSAAPQVKYFKGRSVWESDEEEPPLPQLEESAFHSLKVHFSRIVEMLTQSIKFAEAVNLEKISFLEPISALDHHPFILKFYSLSVAKQIIFFNRLLFKIKFLIFSSIYLNIKSNITRIPLLSLSFKMNDC